MDDSRSPEAQPLRPRAAIRSLGLAADAGQPLARRGVRSRRGRAAPLRASGGSPALPHATVRHPFHPPAARLALRRRDELPAHRFSHAPFRPARRPRRLRRGGDGPQPPAAQTLGPAGGSVTSSDGKVTVSVGPNALQAPAAVSIAPGTADAATAADPALVPGTTYAYTAPDVQVPDQVLIAIESAAAASATSNGRAKALALPAGREPPPPASSPASPPARRRRTSGSPVPIVRARRHRRASRSSRLRCTTHCARRPRSSSSCRVGNRSAARTATRR